MNFVSVSITILYLKLYLFYWFCPYYLQYISINAVVSAGFMNGYWYEMWIRNTDEVIRYLYIDFFYQSFLHAVRTYANFVVDTLKGFVPNFCGNELCIVVTLLRNHGSISFRRDFKFLWGIERFLAICRWNTVRCNFIRRLKKKKKMKWNVTILHYDFEFYN